MKMNNSIVNTTTVYDCLGKASLYMLWVVIVYLGDRYRDLIAYWFSRFLSIVLYWFCCGVCRKRMHSV